MKSVHTDTRASRYVRLLWECSRVELTRKRRWGELQSRTVIEKYFVRERASRITSVGIAQHGPQGGGRGRAAAPGSRVKVNSKPEQYRQASQNVDTSTHLNRMKSEVFLDAIITSSHEVTSIYRAWPARASRTPNCTWVCARICRNGGYGKDMGEATKTLSEILCLLSRRNCCT